MIQFLIHIGKRQSVPLKLKNNWPLENLYFWLLLQQYVQQEAIMHPVGGQRCIWSEANDASGQRPTICPAGGHPCIRPETNNASGGRQTMRPVGGQRCVWTEVNETPGQMPPICLAADHQCDIKHRCTYFLDSMAKITFYIIPNCVISFISQRINM